MSEIDLARKIYFDMTDDFGRMRPGAEKVIRDAIQTELREKDKRIAELEEIAKLAADLDTSQGCPEIHLWLVAMATDYLSKTTNPEQKGND